MLPILQLTECFLSSVSVGSQGSMLSCECLKVLSMLLASCLKGLQLRSYASLACCRCCQLCLCVSVLLEQLLVGSLKLRS